MSLLGGACELPTQTFQGGGELCCWGIFSAQSCPLCLFLDSLNKTLQHPPKNNSRKQRLCSHRAHAPSEPQECMAGGRGGGQGLASPSAEPAMSPSPCRDLGSARAQLSPLPSGIASLIGYQRHDSMDSSIRFSSSCTEARLETNIQPRAPFPSSCSASCAISCVGDSRVIKLI